MTHRSTAVTTSDHTVPTPQEPNDREGFSAVVRDRTAERHSKAEHSTFMSDLMEGALDAEAYVQLLGQYEYIYEALEGVAARFRENGETLVRPFDDPGLDRLVSIRDDLRALRSDDAPATVCLPSTREYVRRIESTAGAPERFLAHHYLRYLGDLSGGQAVAALMARHYGVPAEGLTMYRFEELPKPKVFKDRYRTLLDDAPFTEAQREAFLDEAMAGFDLNAQVFDELAAHRSDAV